MPRESDARQRMVESAALLFRERGVQGTSFADVIAHSGAPRGSIYHHFAGGKAQLAEEATRWAGEVIVAGTVAALEQKDPVAAVAGLGRWWSKLLESTDYGAGCVIAAATLEGEREPALRVAAAETFGAWERALADALERRGVADARAASLATLVVSAVEGAVILARAQQSTAPLERVVGELQRAVAEALGGVRLTP